VVCHRAEVCLVKAVAEVSHRQPRFGERVVALTARLSNPTVGDEQGSPSPCSPNRSTSPQHRISVGEKVHVYIDVSGSMEIVLKALYGAVLDCQEFVHRTIHLFSTKVVDISLSELEAGKCHSTGGTDINCVAEHMARNHVTTRA
jgi:hypothetical protein